VESLKEGIIYPELIKNNYGKKYSVGLLFLVAWWHLIDD
jgi:hypothetical protein